MANHLTMSRQSLTTFSPSPSPTFSPSLSIMRSLRILCQGDRACVYITVSNECGLSHHHASPQHSPPQGDDSAITFMACRRRASHAHRLPNTLFFDDWESISPLRTPRPRGPLHAPFITASNSHPHRRVDVRGFTPPLATEMSADPPCALVSHYASLPLSCGMK